MKAFGKVPLENAAAVGYKDGYAFADGKYLIFCWPIGVLRTRGSLF
jgi:hypothetical protein